MKLSFHVGFRAPFKGACKCCFEGSRRALCLFEFGMLSIRHGHYTKPEPPESNCETLKCRVYGFWAYGLGFRVYGAWGQRFLGLRV